MLGRIHKALAKAGIERIRWHDLRHWSPSLPLGAGVELHDVSEILGHSGIQVTKDTYGHITMGTKRNAPQKLQEVLAQ